VTRFATFTKKMKSRAAKVNQRKLGIMRRIVREFAYRVIEGTPVDVGTARSNWLVTLQRPATRVIDAHAPGRRLGLNEKANAEIAKADARESVARYNETHRSMHVSNNVDYIELLEEGSSRQNAGFIRLALLEAQIDLRSSKLLT
jgi:hypothetical protein